MALNIPQYTDPQTGDTVANAYAWISEIHIANTSGWLVVSVHRTAAAAGLLLPPMERLMVHVGCQIVTPRQAVPAPDAPYFPTLEQVVASAAQAQQADPALDPYSAIRLALYAPLLLHPYLAGGTAI